MDVLKFKIIPQLRTFYRTIFVGSVMFLFTVVPVYAQNLVKNPGFETGALLPYWDVWPKKIIPVAVIETENVFSGNFCARLNGDEVYLYQPVNLEPNTTYTVSATIKSESGDIILFGIGNVYSTGGESRNFSNTNYETQTWSFTTDESPGNDPKIYVWKEINSGVVWIDSVVLIKEPQVIQPKPPGGFSTYYVSPWGNDTNTGTSQAESWQTIDKVNDTDFGPADKILFEGGKTFYGTIVFNSGDHGNTGSEVLIGSYGTGRATINAQNGSGLIAYDCNNVSVKNLNFIGSGPTGGNTGNGITFSYCSDITIDSVDVSGFQHSGLKVNNLGENYTLTNVNAHDNGYAGIYISGLNKSSLSNIYIGYCTADSNLGDPTVLDNHSGNGIFAYNANNILIEFCVASNNGGDMPRTGNGPGGIWVAEVDSVIIQHCISHNNKTSVGGQDGLGFDLDGGTTNSLIQYCLSYNNHGAGYGIFQYDGATDWKNNTVRYCISENDGNTSSEGSLVLWNGSDDSNKFKDFEFYNNVVYNANGPALAFLDHKNSNFNFRNNIFVSKQKSIYNGVSGENFQANCWYSLNEVFFLDSELNFEQWAQDNNQEMLNGEIVGMFADPVFVNPGNSTITDPALMSTVEDYKVLNDSPVIDSGLDLDSIFSINPGTQDYFGNEIKQGRAFDIGVFDLQTQHFSLNSGWNIMSIGVMPYDKNLQHILQPIIDSGNLKKVMDESGNIIENWGVNNGGVQNTIGDLRNTEGYKINVQTGATFDVEGVSVQFPFDIELNQGWNIISWPSPNEQNGKDVFQTLIDGRKLIKVMDEAGNFIENWGELNNGWQNTIGNFKPGEGYKVSVNGACKLTVNAAGSKSETMPTSLAQSTHFVPAFIGYGTDHMNINLMNISEAGILEGDEIGVFDGNICVGSARITNLKTLNTFDNSSISIPVSAAEGNGGKNGYSEGNPITIKLFRDGIEQQLKLEPQNNIKTVFEKGASLFAKVGLSKSLDKKKDSNNTEINCYPNPFNEELTIELNLVNNAEVEVEVISQLGQLVKTVISKRQINSGVHQFTWNRRDANQRYVTPGIYHVRIVVDGIIFYRKIVYFK